MPPNPNPARRAGVSSRSQPHGPNSGVLLRGGRTLAIGAPFFSEHNSAWFTNRIFPPCVFDAMPPVPNLNPFGGGSSLPAYSHDVAYPLSPARRRVAPRTARAAVFEHGMICECAGVGQQDMRSHQSGGSKICESAGLKGGSRIDRLLNQEGRICGRDGLEGGSRGTIPPREAGQTIARPAGNRRREESPDSTGQEAG